ncbi:PA1571 family protein [Porticoccus sp.]|uniref:PA1571 family protein n=1 Tax=Porticoccus sp. TaxID=2024853 RepID=UPI003F6A0462
MGQPKDKSAKAATTPDFHGAALIDDNGREIPITEDMVQNAFSDLGQKTDQPLRNRKSRH